MSLPVLPPTLPRAVRALDAALAMAGPAELVTLERPSEAFEIEAEADCFALAAVSLAFAAASLVVEACRNCPRNSCRLCRRATLEAAEADMTATAGEKLTIGLSQLRICAEAFTRGLESCGETFTIAYTVNLKGQLCNYFAPKPRLR